MGQLGNGSGASSLVPAHIRRLAHVTAIAAAGMTGYALEADGSVWTWGAPPTHMVWMSKSTYSNAIPVQRITQKTDGHGG